MKILILGGSLFVFPFIVQIVLWRTKVVPRTVKNIVKIFLVSWALFIGLKFRLVLDQSIQLLHSFLLAGSLFAAYLLTYTAIEADSPSGLILLKVEQAGDAGLDPAELNSLISDQVAIIKRLFNLHDSGLLAKIDNRYSMTTKGKLFLQLFMSPRKLFTTEDPAG